MRILRFHAHDLKLVPSVTEYMRWGKGPFHPPVLKVAADVLPVAQNIAQRDDCLPLGADARVRVAQPLPERQVPSWRAGKFRAGAAAASLGPALAAIKNINPWREES